MPDGNGLSRYQTLGIAVAILGSYVTAFGVSADRFTGSEADRLTERVRQIELRMAALPNELAPTEVTRTLKRIEELLSVLDSRVDGIEKRLAKVE
jgi:hypothetical protein